MKKNMILLIAIIETCSLFASDTATDPSGEESRITIDEVKVLKIVDKLTCSQSFHQREGKVYIYHSCQFSMMVKEIGNQEYYKIVIPRYFLGMRGQEKKLVGRVPWEQEVIKKVSLSENVFLPPSDLPQAINYAYQALQTFQAKSENVKKHYEKAMELGIPVKEPQWFANQHRSNL